jgi:hypothetical protein
VRAFLRPLCALLLSPALLTPVVLPHTLTYRICTSSSSCTLVHHHHHRHHHHHHHHPTTNKPTSNNNSNNLSLAVSKLTCQNWGSKCKNSYSCCFYNPHLPKLKSCLLNQLVHPPHLTLRYSPFLVPSAADRRSRASAVDAEAPPPAIHSFIHSFPCMRGRQAPSKRNLTHYHSYSATLPPILNLTLSHLYLKSHSTLSLSYILLGLGLDPSSSLLLHLLLLFSFASWPPALLLLCRLVANN